MLDMLLKSSGESWERKSIEAVLEEPNALPLLGCLAA